MISPLRTSTVPAGPSSILLLQSPQSSSQLLPALGLLLWIKAIIRTGAPPLSTAHGLVYLYRDSVSAQFRSTLNAALLQDGKSVILLGPDGGSPAGLQS